MCILVELVGDLNNTFAGDVKAFGDSGDVCREADWTDRRVIPVFVVVSERIAVASLGVWFDSEVFLKTSRDEEENKAANAKCVNRPVPGDGKNHRGKGPSLVCFGEVEPASRMAEKNLAVGLLDTCCYFEEHFVAVPDVSQDTLGVEFEPMGVDSTIADL